MQSISAVDDGFEVKTSKGTYSTAKILLAIGRRGTPRKLGVPGEELPKVVYRLIDPEQYQGQRVLVVGGGDSALETAIALAQCGTRVTLSYRGRELARPKPENVERLEALVADPMADVGVEEPVSERVTTASGRLVAVGSGTYVVTSAPYPAQDGGAS